MRQVSISRIYSMCLILIPAGNRSGANRSNKLMTLMDQVNRKNKGGLFFAGQGIKKKWAIKREHLSPAYTTRWAELPKVR